MSAIALNIVVGLLTSVISGAVVWAWARARATRRQRERARFFGVSPADTCRIVAPQAFGAPRTVAKQDVFSIVELAKLMRDLRADLDVVGSDEGTYGVGDLTEFCVGGPTANVRMQSHLARFLPGVSVRSAPPDRERYREISSAHGAAGSWCIVLRVVAPSIYGRQMTELAADVSVSTFPSLTAARDPGAGHA